MEKTIAEIPLAVQENLGCSSNEQVWHLRILSDEEAQRYKNLEPVEKELIRILRKQDDPETIGCLPVKEAEDLLSELGFDDIPEFMWIEDIVEEFYELDNGETVRWYGLVEEFVKTEKYKKHEEKLEREHDEKVARQSKLIEELDNEEE